LTNKISFVSLLVIIAILTIATAMLAGYIFIFQGVLHDNPENVRQAGFSEIRRPSDDEIEHKKLFNEGQLFILKNENNTKTSIIRIGIDLVYYKKARGIKNCGEKISLFDSEIKELVGTYFQDKTLEQVKDPEFKKKSKEELKKLINDLLNSNERSYSDIVYEIVFYDWFYQ
jgi:flagellar basal body-associated protein FliL